MGSGGLPSLILSVADLWKWMINLSPRCLYLRGKTANLVFIKIKYYSNIDIFRLDIFCSLQAVIHNLYKAETRKIIIC